MSLLLDALKKAEQAKQQGTASPPVLPAASPAQPASGQVAEGLAALDFVLEAPPAVERPPAEEAPSTTPDFPEIVLIEPEPAATAEGPVQATETPAPEPDEPAKTLPPEPATEPEPTLVLAPAPEAPPAPAGGQTPETAQPAAAEPVPPPTASAATVVAAARAEPSPEAGRRTARNVFSSKQPAARRKHGFLLGAVGVGALLAGGMGAYFYWQLSAQQPLPAPAAPPLPPPAARVEEPPPPPMRPETADDADVAPGKDTGKPPVEAAAAPVPAVPDKPARGQDDGAIKIVRSTPSDQVNPLVAGAYKSLASGDLAQAEKGYRQALQQNPRDRDALLGIAAVAAARHRPDEAAGYYLQVLELDPKDAAAQAGLIGVRGTADPVQSESQLKMLLAQHPDAGFLHFALGNLYAQQVRWGEAQSAYFNAFTADPGNAGYAFNLAVSLDHLNQGKLALRYYQEALRLAGDRPTDFGKAQVLDRVRALSH